MTEEDESYYETYIEVKKWNVYYTIGFTVAHIFELYMTVFLLYLIDRFAREAKNAEA